MGGAGEYSSIARKDHIVTCFLTHAGSTRECELFLGSYQHKRAEVGLCGGRKEPEGRQEAKATWKEDIAVFPHGWAVDLNTYKDKPVA